MRRRRGQWQVAPVRHACTLQRLETTCERTGRPPSSTRLTTGRSGCTNAPAPPAQVVGVNVLQTGQEIADLL